jgi:hypothetical protein
MDAISASVGKRLVDSCVKTLMKRMSILLGWCFAVTAILSNGTEANRHETEIFFGANYNRSVLQPSRWIAQFEARPTALGRRESVIK